MKKSKKFLSEFLGTFGLVFCGTGAIVVDNISGYITHVGISMIFGLIVASMIFSFGKSSGAHINPVVSLVFYMKGKITLKELPVYIIAQILGGIVASALLLFLFPASGTLGQTNPVGSVMQSFVLEVIITFILLLVILRLPHEVDAYVHAALSVGFAVMLLAMVAGPVSGASMNPARSIGPALLSGDAGNLWIYLIAPTVGAVLAVPVSRFLD